MGFLLVFIKHFFARCYGWGARGVYHLKISDFALTGAGLPKISRRRGRPHQPLFFSVWYNNLDNLILSKENAFDRKTGGRTAGQTDRQTDRILIARPRLYSMQRKRRCGRYVALIYRIRQLWGQCSSRWRCLRQTCIPTNLVLATWFVAIWSPVSNK